MPNDVEVKKRVGIWRMSDGVLGLHAAAKGRSSAKNRELSFFYFPGRQNIRSRHENLGYHYLASSRSGKVEIELLLLK